MKTKIPQREDFENSSPNHKANNTKQFNYQTGWRHVFFFFFFWVLFCFGPKFNWFTKKCFCKLRSSEAPADADGIHTSKAWRRYRPCSDLHTEVRFSPPPSRNQPLSFIQHTALHGLTLICLIGIPHWCSGVLHRRTAVTRTYPTQPTDTTQFRKETI